MHPTAKSGHSPACPDPSGATCQASVYPPLRCRRGCAGQKTWPGTLLCRASLSLPTAGTESGAWPDFTRAGLHSCHCACRAHWRRQWAAVLLVLGPQPAHGSSTERRYPQWKGPRRRPSIHCKAFPMRLWLNRGGGHRSSPAGCGGPGPECTVGGPDQGPLS